MLALQYYRQKRGLTQTQLGDLVQQHQVVISQIELGHRKPNEQLLDRIADALGVYPTFTLLRPVVVVREQVFLDGAELGEAS